jgi:GNAT superfamily N-acetyltransferase
MKSIYRSLVYHYSQGGLMRLAGRGTGALRERFWSRTEWLIYERDLMGRADGPAQIADHRVLTFADLVMCRYEKALSYPEAINIRYQRSDTCHGFFQSGCLVALGWSGEGYLELSHEDRVECDSAWGLYDFTTLPDFRGRGFYTDALFQLLRLSASAGMRRALIAVDPGNVASRKGIERAGFRYSTKITKRRVLGVSSFRVQGVAGS